MPYTGIMNGSVQTGYFVSPPVALPGQIEFPGDGAFDILGCPVESDFIPFGTGVMQGTIITMPGTVDGGGAVTSYRYGNQVSPFTIVTPTATAGAITAPFVGILARDEGGRNNAAGIGGKQKNDMGGVIRTGFVAVHLFGDTVAQAKVNMTIDEITINGVVIGPGYFVPSAVVGKTIEIPNAVWFASYKSAFNTTGIIQLK